LDVYCEHSHCGYNQQSYVKMADWKVIEI